MINRNAKFGSPEMVGYEVKEEGGEFLPFLNGAMIPLEHGEEDPRRACEIHYYRARSQLVGIAEEGDGIFVKRFSMGEVESGCDTYFYVPCGSTDAEILEMHLSHIACQIADTEQELANRKEEFLRVRAAYDKAAQD